jgi:hypothetical protein
MNRRELMLLLGGSVAAPAPLRAQQKAMPVIGFLASNRMLGSGFNKGLAESGYIETRNIKIETRFALGDYDELAPMAADLLGPQCQSNRRNRPGGGAGRETSNIDSTDRLPDRGSDR